MPTYEFNCKCGEEEKIYTLVLTFEDYKNVKNCPCGSGNSAQRIFSGFTVDQGLTAKEKKFGTTNNRRQMADFMKDQKNVRKKNYAPDTREAKSNEIWLGKEGLDGITQLPIDKKGN